MNMGTPAGCDNPQVAHACANKILREQSIVRE